jgi:hypothetical protein
VEETLKAMKEQFDIYIFVGYLMTLLEPRLYGVGIFYFILGK